MHHECVEERKILSWKKRALIVGALIVGLALIESADNDNDEGGMRIDQEVPQEGIEA